MMKNIVLTKLWQHVSAAISLTLISAFQVLIFVLFYRPHLELYEQDNMGFMQQFFVQCTKDCEKMEIRLPRKCTLLGLTYILLLPTSALPASILFTVTQFISSTFTMRHKMK